MRDLRLTHGGFYRHFRTKEELFVAAFEQGLKQMAHYADSAVKHAPKGGELKALIDSYLSLEHCDHPAGHIGGELKLESVCAHEPLSKCHDSRVVDQHVDRAV